MNADERKSFAAFLRPERLEEPPRSLAGLADRKALRVNAGAPASDIEAIRHVTESAFARPDEADLIDQLRCDGDVLLSLVVEVQEQIVGHILFTRMCVENTPAAALAPMSVL